jgi:cytochrome c oxidase subunit 4
MSSESREVLHDVDAHPVHGTKRYWIIGAYLFVLTGLELAAYFYEDTLGGAATPVILTLSAAKYILVAMFFMHLKYDSKMFTAVFLFPMALATLVISAMIILYHILHVMPR